MKKYKKIKDDIFAKICLYYDKAEVNYLSDNIRRRGLKLSFTTVKKDDGFESYTPMDSVNFKFHLKTMNRRSAKTEEKIWKKLEPHLDLLFDMYIKNRDSNEIFDYLKNNGMFEKNF